MPEHLLVEFDVRYSTVVFVDGLPGHSITADRVHARTPLKPTARRAGWQGCYIDIHDLPRARIVKPQGLSRLDVRKRWKEIRNRRLGQW